MEIVLNELPELTDIQLIKKELNKLAASLISLTGEVNDDDSAPKALAILRKVNFLLASEKNRLVFPEILAIIEKTVGKKLSTTKMIAVGMDIYPLVEKLEF